MDRVSRKLREQVGPRAVSISVPAVIRHLIASHVLDSGIALVVLIIWLLMINNPDGVVGSGLVSVDNSADSSVDRIVAAAGNNGSARQLLFLVVVGAVGGHCSTSVPLFLDREIGSAEDCHQFCWVFFALEELQNVGVHGVLLSKAELIRGKLIFLVDDHGRAVGSQIFLCWLSPFLRSYPFAVELRPGALGASPDALGVLAYNLGFSPAMCPFAGFRLLGNKR